MFPRHAWILDRTRVKYGMVLPNGIDTNLFFPDYDVANDKLKLLFVARLVRGKGVDVVLSLADKLEGLVETHVVGAGALEDEVKRSSNVIYHGIMDDEELARLYRESDVFIYPTHNDNFALVVLQALSSGLYVITSEYVPGGVDSFYTVVKKAIENRKLIDHDKREEYNYVKGNYDWDIIAEKFYGYMRKFYAESNQQNVALARQTRREHEQRFYPHRAKLNGRAFQILFGQLENRS